MNKVEISGRIYNKKVSTTSTGKTVTRFGLSIYTGKDKDGKSQYGFVECKYFGEITDSSELQDVTGRLSVSSWEKDGKKFSRPEIIVDSIADSTMFSESKKKAIESLDSDIDDDINEFFN